MCYKMINLRGIYVQMDTFTVTIFNIFLEEFYGFENYYTNKLRGVETNIRREYSLYSF
jgi:hypothetical protein